MKGNRMKKKPVQKKKIGKLLETFSPVYSIMKGKGPVSNLVASGLGGLAMKPFAERQRAKRKNAKDTSQITPINPRSYRHNCT